MRLRTSLLIGWPLLCALAICAPLLRPGYVLGYDMVFVPDLGLRDDVLGLGTALPRAVPSDAVVAVLDSVVGGAVLSKLVVLAIPAFAGWGMALLVRRHGTVAALAAATLYVWNPFVAERLVLGHWPLLIGYAALPWLVRSCLRLRSGDGLRAWPGFVLASAGCALSASGGLVGALLAVVILAKRGRLLVVAMVAMVGLNAPWWVAGLASPAGNIDPASVGAFAARNEGYGGVLPTLLTLGGVWNADVVPASRGSAVSIVGGAVIFVLAVAGVVWWWRQDRRFMAPLVVAAAVVLVIALAGAVLPGLMRSLVEAVPGAGLFRDGQRYLGPLALLEAAGFGMAACRVVKASREWAGRVAVLAGLVLVPVAVVPDLAWAADGGTGVAAYPKDWVEARAVVRGAGDLITWPYEAYRAPEYAGGRAVLDPVPRYFPRPAVVPDELVVGGVRLAGEDPRASAIATALRSGGDATATLRANGIGWIVADRTTRASDPRKVVPGARAVFEGPTVAVFGIDDPAQVRATTGRKLAVTAAWVAALLVLGSMGAGARRVWRKA